MKRPNDLMYKQNEFVRRLLLWRSHNAQPFPWRETRDPYRIWLAEVLLQRTRANMVAREYPTIIRSIPTVHALSKSPLSRIRRIIRRLGLPHRASYLKAGARYIAVARGGQFPSNELELRRVPGTGPYVASAVALFFFGERTFPVDVNIVRILGRLFGLKSSRARPHTDDQFRVFLSEVVPLGREKDFMYGLLDLSMRVCIGGKHGPNCMVCPMRNICEWYSLQESRPELI